jgi:hypothetical protein
VGLQSQGTRPSPPFTTVALYLLGVALVAAGITLLFLGMRAVMDIGGYCAEGGPYVIATPCPEGAPVATLLGIFGGLAGFFLAFWKGAEIGERATGVLFLAWPALFGALGFNFFQYGFDPPGDDPGWAWGWIVCGVVFWAMAFGPILLWWWSAATARRIPRRGAIPSPGPAPTRLEATWVARSAPRPRPGPAADPSAAFPLEMAGLDAAPPAPDLVDDLERLATLHREGALTDDEYARAKVQLLERPGR